jgi:hypothetical protein
LRSLRGGREFRLQLSDNALQFQVLLRVFVRQILELAAQAGFASRKRKQPKRRNEQHDAVKERDQVKEGFQGHGFL